MGFTGRPADAEPPATALPDVAAADWRIAVGASDHSTLNHWTRARFSGVISPGPDMQIFLSCIDVRAIESCEHKASVLAKDSGWLL